MKDSLTITVSKKDDGSWQGVWKMQRNNLLYGNAIRGEVGLHEGYTDDGFWSPLDELSEITVTNFLESLEALQKEERMARWK